MTASCVAGATERSNSVAPIGATRVAAPVARSIVYRPSTPPTSIEANAVPVPWAISKPMAGEDGVMPVVSRPSSAGPLGWSMFADSTTRISGESRPPLPGCRPRLPLSFRSPPREMTAPPSFPPTDDGSPLRRTALEIMRSGCRTPTGPTPFSSAPWPLQ